VANRVEQGGHGVNKNKISARYERTLENLYDAVKLSNRVYLFDNSGKTLELIAEIFDGALQLKVDDLPKWFVKYVLPHYRV